MNGGGVEPVFNALGSALGFGFGPLSRGGVYVEDVEAVDGRVGGKPLVVQDYRARRHCSYSG